MREEENKSVSKNNWKRVFRKKWFFPSVYLVAAALILTGVLVFQSMNQNVDNVQPEEGQQEGGIEYSYEDDQSVPVMDLNENLNMPVLNQDQAVIKTKFYDHDSSSEEKEQAIIQFNNKFYQSNGIDIAREDGESFDVVASATGTVTEVKEDALYGKYIEITHEDDIKTRYMSLGDVLVEVGAKVNQDDVIGTSGRSLAGQASGLHVHFEVRNGDQALNPEDYFFQPLSKLKDQTDANAEADKEEGAEVEGEGEGQDQDLNQGEDQGQTEDGSEDVEDGESTDADEDKQPETEQPNEDEEESSISMTNA
ncbi:MULTISPECIES: M23 family metallopeptidase [Pontibacillus]|uniref:Peptidoglycan DD-metalloendopeptidase family protein n=1 Tax=Pontibacillus chungwhensis TaxID=265426 RepID=A0ABY8UW05_9BACI|nr:MULTISPECIES: M23 family metallopeptidase [Pontibacillus]MCD5324081.1 peptidoglycan DD-metalloendopeptidase family protein [Pontibacillus sp. HN14]WIF97862.1 peptidoglycan DD-metalloendopeptidase family protein [Pontibacillus chungwhensis]